MNIKSAKKSISLCCQDFRKALEITGVSEHLSFLCYWFGVLVVFLLVSAVNGTILGLIRYKVGAYESCLNKYCIGQNMFIGALLILAEIAVLFCGFCLCVLVSEAFKKIVEIVQEFRRIRNNGIQRIEDEHDPPGAEMV
jgi:hypothetical protein